jgi:hypothetical protein
MPMITGEDKQGGGGCVVAWCAKWCLRVVP